MAIPKDNEFKVVADFLPAGDQPKAIELICQGIKARKMPQTLLGVTGSGKTLTMAHVIQETKMPAIILAHNKTLAAQLYNEMSEFFPNNHVEYFISYYDYYQPESYIPSTDTFIEKEASINEEIDRLRHSTTRSIYEHSDVIVVASVSAIYGLGVPERYYQHKFTLTKGSEYDRQALIYKLIDIHYKRNDFELKRASFRVRGDVLEVFPAYEENIIRLDFFGDELEKIVTINPVSGEVLRFEDSVTIYPAKHYVLSEDELAQALDEIKLELNHRLGELNANNKLVEAYRLSQRTNFDLEMIAEMGYCNGIENYSRILENRKVGEPPQTLMDYFVRRFGAQGFLTFIDESHVSVPQLKGMYKGDAARKDTLIEHGFRLPCARDNRPLMFDEFWAKAQNVIFVSATPADFELDVSCQVVEQIIRPTGLVDPVIEIRPIKTQIDDLIKEIKVRQELKQRTLVTTLTKRMAEDLSDYLNGLGLNVKWLHSDIDALDRVELLRDLRLGIFDVLIGINLLREGLDLPEVTLVAIMEADKEGFLRSQRSLIQTIGRAARNVDGKVILYADKMTDSMNIAVTETNRRRKIQLEYNAKHNITPKTIQKSASNSLLEALRGSSQEPAQYSKASENSDVSEYMENLNKFQLNDLAKKIEKEMNKAARVLDFERAALLRDQLKNINNSLKKK